MRTHTLLMTLGLLATTAACSGRKDTGEVEEEDEEEEEEETVEVGEGPDRTALPFQECPAVDAVRTFDESDLRVAGTTATASGTFMRCATWDFEESAGECYADSSNLYDSVHEFFYDLAFAALGGVLPVDCEVESRPPAAHGSPKTLRRPSATTNSGAATTSTST